MFCCDGRIFFDVDQLEGDGKAPNPYGGRERQTNSQIQVCGGNTPTPAGERKGCSSVKIEKSDFLWAAELFLFL